MGRRRRETGRVKETAHAGTWSHGTTTGVAFGPPRSGLVLRLQRRSRTRCSSASARTTKTHRRVGTALHGKDQSHRRKSEGARNAPSMTKDARARTTTYTESH